MSLLVVLTVIFGTLSFILACLLLKQKYSTMPAKKQKTQLKLRSKKQNTKQVPAASVKGADKFSAPQKFAARKSNPINNDELKMVIVVRTDLKMEKGKMAAQCCHSAVEAAEITRDDYPDIYNKWKQTGSAKIVLKCTSENELTMLEEKGASLGLVTACICDAGRTQIAPGSLTCCAFGPQRVSLINKVTGSLKLL